MTMTVEDPGTMEAMLGSGMVQGMEASYAQLDAMAAEAA